MALIKCPECGKSVSDAAQTCPYCGIKIQGLENLAELSYLKEFDLKRKQEEEKKKTIVIIICVVIGIFFIIYIWYNATSMDRAEKKLKESQNKIKNIEEQINDAEKEIRYNEYIIDLYED